MLNRAQNNFKRKFKMNIKPKSLNLIKELPTMMTFKTN